MGESPFLMSRNLLKLDKNLLKNNKNILKIEKVCFII